jgi:hypothetical protein
MSGGNQFGQTWDTASSSPQAAMWSGTAQSYVSMAPAGSDSSAIAAAAGALQGGGAVYGGFERAGLWSGSAASFVSIHPGAGYSESFVFGMSAGEQAGQARSAATTFNHAALWHGTAASFVDLDPGWDLSSLSATLGGVEVGYAATDPSTTLHAGIWFGTAASFLDLSRFLPPGYTDSQATSIATDGTHYYVGGYARLPGSYTNAFLWVGTVPAPGAGLLLLAGGGLTTIRRRRKVGNYTELLSMSLSGLALRRARSGPRHPCGVPDLVLMARRG